MSLTDFKSSPWQRPTSHPAYRESALSMSPAPEYASSEVLVASLYRTIGMSGVTDGQVPQAGKNLERKLQKCRDKREELPEGSTLDSESWGAVLHGVLESPKLPNQSAKRFLQVTPLVPSLSRFSGSARLSANSWPAGSLVRRMVWLGSGSHEEAMALWNDLFVALGVDDDDDVFARWLEQEASAWASGPKWQAATVETEDVALLEVEDFERLQFLPARRFAKDLRAVIQAKPSMTRRQWTSLLEAVVRLAAVSHITWLCDVQARAWRCVAESLEGRGPVNEHSARLAVFPSSPQYMTYGGKALHSLKDKVSGYLLARLGLNTILWSLDDCGAPYEGKLSSSADIARLCDRVRAYRELLASSGMRELLSEVREQEARALNCKKGIGANILEFARHALGQRQTASALLRGYDQGYVLRKRGADKSSPWVVSLGPVAVLAMVHCALAGMGGPRSIHRLGQHLEAYGIAVDRHDIARNDLGHQLRMLGLVLDSPDAESGMLLLPPFATTLHADPEK